MADIVAALRVGGFVIFRDEDGLRHAVRSAAILALSDADEAGTSTAMQMTGNRVVVIQTSFDEVLEWFA
jgi:hypothetical protein